MTGHIKIWVYVTESLCYRAAINTVDHRAGTHIATVTD